MMEQLAFDAFDYVREAAPLFMLLAAVAFADQIISFAIKHVSKLKNIIPK